MPNFSEFITNIQASDLLFEGEANIILRFSIQAGGLQGPAVSRSIISLSVSGEGANITHGIIQLPLIIQGRNTSIGQALFILSVSGSGEQKNSTNLRILLQVIAEGRNISNEAIISFLLSAYASGNLNVLYTLCEDKNNNL